VGSLQTPDVPCHDITKNVVTLMSMNSEVKFVWICARKKAPSELGRDSYS
jgi:hypothetical protein